jgi:hypothetical protein
MTALGVEASIRTSVVGHFRVSKNVYDSLEDEARSHNVSLNTLVNQVLSSHTRDDWVFEEVGFVKMPKDAFRALLGAIPDCKLSELGTGAVKTGRDTMMLAKSGSISLNAILEDLHFLSRCGWFSLHEAKANGKTVITLVHEFGPRQSILMAADAVNLFGLVGIRPNVTTTNSSVMIEF